MRREGSPRHRYAATTRLAEIVAQHHARPRTRTRKEAARPVQAVWQGDGAGRLRQGHGTEGCVFSLRPVVCFLLTRPLLRVPRQAPGETSQTATSPPSTTPTPAISSRPSTTRISRECAMLVSSSRADYSRAYEIATFFHKEPPPKEWLEDRSAAGGAIMTRTAEDFMAQSGSPKPEVNGGDSQSPPPTTEKRSTHPLFAELFDSWRAVAPRALQLLNLHRTTLSQTAPCPPQPALTPSAQVSASSPLRAPSSPQTPPPSAKPTPAQHRSPSSSRPPSLPPMASRTRL